MQKYIVEQLLSSFHARALLHAVIVEPIGSQPDFILFIFMTLKTPNIFSCLSTFQIYLFSYSFNGDKTCEYDKYTCPSENESQVFHYLSSSTTFQHAN